MQNSNYQMGSIPGPSTIPSMRNQMQGNQGNDGLKMSFAHALQRQPKPSQGWQVTFNAQYRLNNLMKMFTLTRMRSNQLGTLTDEQLKRIGSTTLDMERKLFLGCNTQDQYQQMIQKRCAEISAQQQPIPNMQPPPYMQNQQQYPNGVPNGRDIPQMNGQQPLQNGQSNFPQPPAPQAPMQQSNQQRPPSSQNLTEDEMRATLAQAQRTYESASRDGRIQQIQQQISALAPGQQRMLGQQGNPVLSFIQMKIRAEYLKKKAQMASAQNEMPRHQQNGRMMRTPMPGQSQFGGNGAPFDPSQFAGLQAQALRSQASGDDVVPASNNQYPNGQPPMFKNQPGQNFPRPNQLPPRNQNQGSAQSRVMTDQASAHGNAQAHAQARMNQRKPPQQDGLQGQVGGLHSDNAGRFTSPMATLNQPLSNQPMHTPRPPQNRQPGPSPMQFTPQPAQGPHQHRPPQGQVNVPHWVTLLPAPLQNVYRSMPDEMKARANNVAPEQAFRTLQSMYHRQMQGQDIFGGRQQNAQRPPQPPAPQVPRPQGAGMGQPPNMNQPWQQQGQMMPQPQPGMMPPNAQQIMNQFPGGRAGVDAMPLPREEMTRSIPNINIPNHLGTWGAFMQWARESLPVELQKTVFGFQQRWIANETRKRAQQQQPPSADQGSSAQDLTKDSNFLQTQHVNYNTINERAAVRSRMVVMINGMPRPAPPTQEQIANFKRLPQFVGHNEHTLRQMYMQSNMQKLRTTDEPLWKEIIRVQHNIQQNAGTQGPPQGPGFQPQQQPQQGLKPGGPMIQGMPGRQQQPPQHFQAQANRQPGQGLPQGANDARPASRQSGRGVQNDKTRPPSSQQQANVDNRKQQPAAPLPPQAGQKLPDGGPVQEGAHQAPNDRNLPSITPQEAEEFNGWRQDIAARAKNSLGQFQKHQKQVVSRVITIMDGMRSGVMFKALHQAAPLFWQRFRNQQIAIDLLAKHMVAMFRINAQKPQQDMLSMPPNEIMKALREIGDFLNRVSKTFAQPGAPGQHPQPQQAQPTANQPQQQQQAPEIVRAPSRQDRKNDVPPPAPTSEKAPFTFDSGPAHQHLSPDGTPRAYGNMNFDPNKISIPARKRKHGSESTKGTPTPQPLKPEAGPEQQIMSQPPISPGADVKHPFACPVPLCDQAPMGYATQDDADKHAKTVHHYHDELEFCLRSLRDALNLDVLGNPKLKAEANNVAGNGLATKGTTAGNPERVNTQRSNEPSQDLSAPLVVQPGETLTQAIQRHETSQHTGSSTPILQKQPHDPWQNSNITRSTLLNLFSDIPDFPQYRSDPTSAFTIAFPEERWPDNAPGRTIQEISEGVRLAQADKEANTAPEDVIHVRLEDYNPWPDSNGGVDPYEGKIVNIIKDERPHEWSMDYDKLESEWCDPENIWRQVGERLAWERANPPWYEDLGNEDIRAFMEGRLRDIGKDQKGGEKMEEEKEEEEEAMVEDSGIGGEDEAKEESPTKRVKVSP